MPPQQSMPSLIPGDRQCRIYTETKGRVARESVAAGPSPDWVVGLRSWRALDGANIGNTVSDPWRQKR